MKMMNGMLAVGAAALLTVGVAAQAEELKLPGWYAGIDLGRSDFRSRDGGLDGAFANQGLATSTSMDKRGNAWQLDLGYRFNRWLALEGGYVDFGRFDYNSVVFAPSSDTISGRLKSDAFRLSAVAIAPLDYGFAVYGKVGMFDARTRLEGTSASGLDVGASHSHADGTFGVGASYDFSSRLSANVEWNRYLRAADSPAAGTGDIDLVTAGLALHF